MNGKRTKRRGTHTTRSSSTAAGAPGDDGMPWFLLITKSHFWRPKKKDGWWPLKMRLNTVAASFLINGDLELLGEGPSKSQVR